MAGRIPQHFIDELLTRVDIVDVIDRRVPLKRAGKDYTARCPFHDERTPSFTVSQIKQFYHCFGCGANGTAISFLMDYEHMEFREAIEDLAGMAGMQVPEEAPERSVKRREGDTLLPLLEQASRLFQAQLRHHPAAPAAVDYLKQRGLSGAIAKSFELGFAPDEWDALRRGMGEHPVEQLERAGLVVRNERGHHYDRFRGRVMFPIRDHRGRVIGFGGRIIGDGEPKYLNSPETPVFHKGSELYGLFRARESIRDLDHAIVVEGYMDVVALAQHGIDNAVATLGTATTAQHLHRLFRLAPHVVFCFDGDRAGRDAARKAMNVSLPEMHRGRQVSFLFLPEGRDPDDFVRASGAEAFRQAAREARPLDEFLFEHLAEQTDLSRHDGRARMVELARPLLSLVPPGPYKEILKKRLGEVSGLDDDRYLDSVIADRTAAPPPRRQETGARERAGPTRAGPYRHLISLLVQHPRMVRKLPEIEGLDAVEHPGAHMLDRLIAILREDDLVSTAALLERFRGEPEHPALEKLAAWDHRIVDGRLEETVLETAASVRREVVDSAIGALLEQSAAGPLSDEQKAALSRFNQLRVALMPGAGDPA